MFERMLNKEVMPAIEEMENVIGTERIQIFEELDEFLRNSYEGWMHYRVLSNKELNDVKELIRIKKKQIY